MSPVDRAVMTETAMSMARTLAQNTKSMPTRDESNDNSNGMYVTALKRARIFYAAYIYEGLNSAMKGHRIVL